MIEKDLMRRLMALDDLPTLPQVMQRILETVDDERSSAKDLTALLEGDPSISARVLRLSNSAFFGLKF